VKWVNQRTAGDEWTLRFGDSSPDHPDFDIGDSPQVYKLCGRLVVSAGQKSGFFHVLDAKTGEEISDPLQVAPPGTVGGLFADSAYAGGVNFANGTDWPAPFTGPPPNKGIIAAVSADGSEELWRFETPGSPNISGVAVANGVVYFQSTLNGSLFALDAASGDVLAEVVTGSVTSGPAVSRGQVYLGTGDAAFVYLTGAPLAPASVLALGLPDSFGRAAAAPRISVADTTVKPAGRGRVNLSFTVTLSAPSDQPVTVRFATANGTAVAGSDYRRSAGVVRFAAGETVKTINIRVRASQVSGDAETFSVKLHKPTNAVLQNAEGIGTIMRG
jgi:hypothetical protein